MASFQNAICHFWRIGFNGRGIFFVGTLEEWEHQESYGTRGSASFASNCICFEIPWSTPRLDVQWSFGEDWHINAEKAAEQHTAEYTWAGLPGCIGSTDATHKLLEKKVDNCLRQSQHLGFKSSQPHCKRLQHKQVRIIVVTTYLQQEHGIQQDGMTRHMFFLTFLLFLLMTGAIWMIVTFELYHESDCDGNIEKVSKYRGACMVNCW